MKKLRSGSKQLQRSGSKWTLRHLRNGHKTKLEERSADENVPVFVDVDGPSLVEKEEDWIEGSGEDDEDEEDDANREEMEDDNAQPQSVNINLSKAREVPIHGGADDHSTSSPSPSILH